MLYGKIGRWAFFCPPTWLPQYKFLEIFQTLNSCNSCIYSRPKGGFLILWPSQTSSWSGVLCVAGKNVNFYAKKSNQVAASGGFRHNHQRKNIPFVWDQSNVSVSWWRRRVITIEKSHENWAFQKTIMLINFLEWQRVIRSHHHRKIT